MLLYDVICASGDEVDRVGLNALPIRFVQPATCLCSAKDWV
jgi:hypothetical protein